MITMDGITQGQASQDISVNSALVALSAAALFGYRATTTTGLTLGLYGGMFTKLDGTMAALSSTTTALLASTTNYVVAAKVDGAVTAASNTTNWNDTANYYRLCTIATGASAISTNGYTDFREIGRINGGAANLLLSPVTKTASFTLGAAENEVICNGSASITVTMPAASAWVGRNVRIKTRAAFTVISASSNVKPLDSDTAGTAILAATAGKWAELVSDGANWVVMAGN